MNLDWMMPNEIYNWLVENVEEGSTILEFGSGHGSITLAKRYDLISIEHNKEWIGISDSRYIHAKITENAVSSENNQLGWYELSPILEVIQTNTIAVFIIDGPPGNIGRHGFLSLLESIPENAIFIVDDLHREAELDIFNRLNEWVSGDSKIYSAFYENGKERKWGVVQPRSKEGIE